MKSRQHSRTPLNNSSNPSLNRKPSRDVDQTNSKDGSAEHLAPSRIEELNKPRNDISRTGSDADSLLDLYRHPPNRSTSSMDVREVGKSNGRLYIEDDDLDSEKWIHRDKLAKIESAELQAAGINLASMQRSSSKSQTRRDHSHERQSGSSNGTGHESWPENREEKRQRIHSPVAEEQEPEQQNWDPRSPAEIVGDATEERNTSGVYQNTTFKKSKSRIPVLASNPVPTQDRDTPQARKRTISGSSPDGEIAKSFRSHNRQGSAGSQILLDEGGGTATSPISTSVGRTNSKNETSPKKKVPVKASTPSTSNPTSRKITPNSRKASNARSPSNSTNSPSQRPATRSGDDRPRTAMNRPEGDPPWLATMYKPDPMLPPDQQIIPTLAKRQQAAQWNEEGAIVKIYDRDFSPLAVHTQEGLQRPAPHIPPKPPSQPSPQSPEKPKPDMWPLQPISRTASTNSRPGTSGTDRGGYSTMPKVASSPLASSMPSPIASAPPVKVQQQPLAPEISEKKEKKCGCCVVM